MNTVVDVPAHGQPGIEPGTLSFGVRLPNSGPLAQPENIVRIARAADDRQFAAVWVHDHIPWQRAMLTHFSSGSVEACQDQDPNFFESLTTATFIAGMFPRLTVGLAGIVLPLRDPRVLAKQLMTVQALTGQRLTTALAIGNIANDFEVMQVPFNQRGKITDEYLAALDRILHDEKASFHGERITFDDAEFYPKPAQNNLWIAGNSPPAYRRIARYGTGWLPGLRTPAEYAENLAALEHALTEHGRGVDEINCGVEQFIAIRPRHDDAVQVAGKSLEHRAGSLSRGLSTNLVGSPDHVIENIHQFRKAGVTHFELRFLCHDLAMHEEMLAQFAEEVLPELS